MRTTPGHPVNRAHPPGRGGHRHDAGQHGACAARCRRSTAPASTPPRRPCSWMSRHARCTGSGKYARLEWLPVTGRDLNQVVEAGWASALAPVADRIAAMGDFLRAEIAAGRRDPPAGENVLRAFKQPFADVRVLIMGQDPYPAPGCAVGLSFSVPPELRRLPPSLVNIFREYTEDLGYPAAGHRRPVHLDGARGAAAQPRPHRPAGKDRLPPREGLGGSDRAGHPGARRPGHAAGRDPLGPGRAQPGAPARPTCRSSSPPTPARTPPTAGSSGRGRSAGPASS